MRKEYEYSGEGYYLKLQEGEDGLQVTACGGRASLVKVPETVEGMTVTGIAKKAFLSRKHIRELILPRTIKRIEDWAFAYCGQLEQITLPGGLRELGKAVLVNGDALQRINCVTDVELHQWSEDVAYLLAGAVKELEAYYLLDLQAAGSEEWFAKWDAKLLAVMEEDDNEGYLKQVLCGEEDYGSTDLVAFLSAKRKKKVRLCMLRLQHTQLLKEDMRTYLSKYLQKHIKGCEQEETWQVLLQERNTDKESWDLFLELGCATNENMEGMLEDMGENYPEMKAYFLRYKAEKLGYEDFFSGLEF
ncbi:MAG: leucine-rich repeat protein [Lachnospiraceae bacterium]|nr:leucine-rich repeat protein [Lachnospiraceae bacterium]